MLISSYKIPRGIMVAYTTLFLEISFVGTKACPIFGMFIMFILRLFATQCSSSTSAQCASSSVFEVTCQESLLVHERCFQDKLKCCYNFPLFHISLHVGSPAIGKLLFLSDH